MSGSSSIVAMKKVVQQLRLEAGINRVKVTLGQCLKRLQRTILGVLFPMLWFLFNVALVLMAPKGAALHLRYRSE